MDHNTISKLTNSFDTIVRQIPDEDTEFWYAREIMAALGYDRWENFSKVIHKVSIACEGAGGVVANHFRGVTKMVHIGSGAERPVEDIMLTRYACYLNLKLAKHSPQMNTDKHRFFEPRNTQNNPEREFNSVEFDGVRKLEAKYE